MDEIDKIFYESLPEEDKQKFLVFGPFWAKQGIRAIKKGKDIIPVPDRAPNYGLED